MLNIGFDPIFKAQWPEMQLYTFEAEVVASASGDELLQAIREAESVMQQDVVIEKVSQHPAIASSRKAYKRLGKDPARYRLSAEALQRRVVKGNQLYQISNVVDCINLASLTSGFSIGAYDAALIEGDIVLGIGKKDEPYEALGRGVLNIENLPVLRDDIGAFGSPTSDSVRTGIQLKTSRILVVYFGFGAHQLLKSAGETCCRLLEQHASASVTNVKTIGYGRSS
jgi:DNA/RNA-binding domain of Phe-tRNA-synthetase-like protein